MTISEIIKQGLYYARTCKSLWLFGFVVGTASGSSSGVGGGQGAGGGWSVGIGPVAFSVEEIAPIVHLIILAFLVLIVVRSLGEGALIEGVARAHRGGTMTIREGFRAGWAHWGVLVRIALLYFAVSIGSLAVLAAPCVLAVQALGPLGGVVLGIPLLLVGAPWLVTLYLVQTYAARIAVLENRHAFDAIGKSRLFLHGRLMQGLRLLAAMFVGTLVVVFLGLLVTIPLALLLIALIPVQRLAPVIVVGLYRVVAGGLRVGRPHRSIVESRWRNVMNDEEFGNAWTTLRPSMPRRQRIDARVFAWLEARDTPLAAEWLGLFRAAPFAALGLATVGAVSIVTATPLPWFVRALL